MIKTLLKSKTQAKNPSQALGEQNDSLERLDDTDTLFSEYALGQRHYQKNPSLSLFGRLFSLPPYHWLLVAVFFVLCVHLSYMPFWLFIFGVVSVIFALPWVKGRVSRRPKRLKSIYQGVQMTGFLAGLFGIWLTFGQFFGADVSISFLLLCLVAKLWELNKKRDAYVLLNLSLFVLAAAFLWSQSLGMTVMVLLALLLVMTGFIALADADNDTGAGRARALAWVMVPSLPLLLVLFLFFPRLPPLWSIQMAGKQATTGVSDSMSPGDFANLSRSTELAFRVEWQDVRPSRKELYWRGMVFSEFDGVTWRPDSSSGDYWRSMDSNAPSWATPVTGKAAGSYSVILEPTYQEWLFGLDYSRLEPTRRLGMTDEYTLRSFRPIAEQLRYQLHYYPEASVGLSLSDRTRALNVSLPETGNAKSRELATTLFSQAGGDTDRYIDLVQSYIADNEFFYTLSPPALGGERIDEFLFGTRRGFCEHYASSFVFLMRAAGVPARVVAGYQGGELGRDGNSWEVRQMDAHAWAEVWHEGQGWVRVDPTGFVAPSRIEDGMDALTETTGAAMFGDGLAGQMGYQQFRLLQQFRRYSDQMSYYWQKDIVGYDSDSQKSALLNWFNIKSLAQQVAALTGGFLLFFGLVGFVFWYRRRVVYHAFDKPIMRLSAKLAKQDKQLEKGTHEPVLAYLKRLETQAGVADTEPFSEVMTQYRRYRFGKEAQLVKEKSYQTAAKAFSKQVAALARLF